MKKTILTALVFYIFTAFGSAALGGKIKNAEPSHICLKVGNRWVYKLSRVCRGEIFKGTEVNSVKSEEMLNGIKVSLYSVDNPGGGEIILYLTSDTEGSYLHKMVDSRGEYTVLSSPLPLDRRDLQLGKKYTNSVPAKFYGADNKLIHKGAMKTEFKLLGYEDVVVPAGKFDGCTKYSLLFIQQKGKNLITNDQVRWYRKDIGSIKAQSFIKIEEDGKEVYREYSETELEDSNKIKR